MTEKGPKTLIKSCRTPHTEKGRKCNFSWLRAIHGTFIAMGLKIHSILFENLRLVTLESGERSIAFCSV